MPSMIAYFIRHGDTPYNAQKRFRGLQDVPLDEKGLEDTAFIRDHLSDHLDRIYASDLTRAQQTAEVLSGGQIPVHTLPLLRPWDVGAFSGKPKNSETLGLIRQLAASDQPTPGGERLSDFARRYHQGLKTIWEHASDLQPDGAIAIVSHASNIHELGKILHGDINALNVDPGGVVKVTGTPGGDAQAEVLSKPAPPVEEGIS